MTKIKNKWKFFFIYLSTTAIVLTLLSVIATYAFEKSLPEDCEACGMGAVGLVPLWLINIIAVIVLLVGFLIWLYTKTNKLYIKIGIIIMSVAALVYFAVSFALAY